MYNKFLLPPNFSTKILFFFILRFVAPSFFVILPHNFIYRMELQGTVKKIFDIQTFPSGFQKREMILLTQEQYPQPISIEFLSEKISLLDTISEGEEVKVGINIRGREWVNPQGETKYFNSITAWRLEKTQGGAATSMPTQPVYNETPAQPAASNTNVFEDEDDDLPF